MKEIIRFTKLVLALVVLFILLTGCTTTSKTEVLDTLQPEQTDQADDADTPAVETDPSDTSDNNTEAPEVLPYSFPENPVVFDFAVLPEDKFPRGSWTVNQLVAKLEAQYGTPEDMYGYYSHQYLGATDIVFVHVVFKDLIICFNIESADRFSFFKDSIEDGSYDLNERDKNLKLEILDLYFDTENASLPHGITVGHTTKSQVLEAYPAGSAYTWKDSWMRDTGEESYVDLLDYYYGFRDEEGNLPQWYSPPWSPGVQIGTITYSFDKNELLTYAQVRWWFFDI